jgi:hypothetical protein
MSMISRKIWNKTSSCPGCQDSPIVSRPPFQQVAEGPQSQSPKNQVQQTERRMVRWVAMPREGHGWVMMKSASKNMD